VLQQVAVVVAEQVLDHIQNVHRRIGEELEPTVAPVADQGGADLKANDLVVLKELDEWEDE